MTAQQFEQIKSYSILIVYELHKIVFDDAVFDKLKNTLALAEELECYMMAVERKAIEFHVNSNVIPIRLAAVKQY